MAYRTRRSYGRPRARGGYRSRSSGYGRRRVARRGRRVSARGRTARIVVQVVGGPAGVAASPLSLGQKAARPVKARY